MYRIVLCQPGIAAAGLNYLKAHAEVFLAPDGKKETIVEWINRYKADAFIDRYEFVDYEMMVACPSLRVIGEHGAGVDNIDVSGASALGIKVLNVPDANYSSVAEHAMAMILALGRRIVWGNEAVRNGFWEQRNKNMPADVSGKTLLIVGFGRSGKALAKRAAAFDMRILVYTKGEVAESFNQYAVTTVDSLDEGLQQSDFVSLHVPLTPETRGMISTVQLHAMKRSSYLINMSRGAVVDEDALIWALQTKEIAGAGVDVFVEEPPRKDHPLLHMDQVIVSPHVAGCSKEALERLATRISKAVIDALDGKDTDNWLNKDMVCFR